MTQQARHIKIHHPTVRVEDLLALESEVFTNSTSKHGGPLARNEITTLFEKAYEGKLDLTLEEVKATRYQSSDTELAYQAFKKVMLGQQLAITRASRGTKVHRDKLVQLYINGRFVDDNTVEFSKRPFVKKSAESACNEAKRLSEKYGGKFGAFGLYKSFGDTAVAPDKTKTGSRGRPSPNPTLVMNRLCDHIRDNVSTDIPTPLGILVKLNGGISVPQTLGQPLEFPSHNLAIEYIHDWLNKHASKQPKE